MGKGDKKTKKGKISMGSYGVKRPRKQKKVAAPAKAKVKPVATAEKVEAKKAPVKKAPAKKAAKSAKAE
jgi:30S ribosomal protein S31